MHSKVGDSNKIVLPWECPGCTRRHSVSGIFKFAVGPQERLQQQKEEAQSNPEYGTTFKDQLTKDEKKARRKQILANIGEACSHALACAIDPAVITAYAGTCLQSQGDSRSSETSISSRKWVLGLIVFRPCQAKQCTKGHAYRARHQTRFCLPGRRRLVLLLTAS